MYAGQSPPSMSMPANDETSAEFPYPSSLRAATAQAQLALGQASLRHLQALPVLPPHARFLK